MTRMKLKYWNNGFSVFYTKGKAYQGHKQYN